jgi:lipoprotein-releasing system permease protein
LRIPSIPFFMKEAQNKLPNIREEIIGVLILVQESDATYVIGDIRTCRESINGNDQVGAFEVFVDDFDNIKICWRTVYQKTGSTLDTKTIIERRRKLYI